MTIEKPRAMLRATCLICTLALVACSSDSVEESVLDTSQAERDLQARNTLEARFNEMVQVLQLNSTESASLKVIYDEGNTAFKNWIEGDKGKRLVQLEAEMKLRANETDLRGVRRAIAEAKPLREEIVKLVKDSYENLLVSVGHDRRMMWEGHRLGKLLLELMGPLAISPEQSTSIHAGSLEFYTRAYNAREPNPRAFAFLELEQWVEKDVLSPTQREQYQAIKKDNPMRSLG